MGLLENRYTSAFTSQTTVKADAIFRENIEIHSIGANQRYQMEPMAGLKQDYLQRPFPLAEAETPPPFTDLPINIRSRNKEMS
jgi:hypothetical protein